VAVTNSLSSQRAIVPAPDVGTVVPALATLESALVVRGPVPLGRVVALPDLASPPTTPEPAAVVPLLPLAAPIHPDVDATSGSFTEDSLPTSEFQLHITINVVSRLNAAEEAWSLSVVEVSLREFLLDQLLLL
jgi:hypothetical protein